MDRLTFIRRCRSFGFSIAQVRVPMLVMAVPYRDCQGTLDLAREHLSDVRVRMAGLRALEATLTDIVSLGEDDCPGGRGPDCTVLRALKTDDAARAQA
ncbi:MAG: MerR family DNA-binding protein [Pseudomonadota bacterium]